MLVAYLYDISGKNIIAQYFKIGDFQCKKVLNDTGTCSFTIDRSKSEISLIAEFLRCRVVLVAGRTEKTIFDGVVKSLGATSSGITVTLNDFLFIFSKKKLYSAKTYSSVSVSSIVSEIFGEINARYDTGITLETSETDTISPEYNENISFLDVLKDIGERGYEFDVVDMKLILAKTIGTDRTMDPNLVEFRYDYAVIREKNISEYTITRDAENIANAVTGTYSEGSNTQTDAASIAKYGRIEESYSVDGDTASATTALLAEHKDSVTEISITPDTNDFFLANLGDIVKVYIDGGNTIQFFDGSLKVIEKSMNFSASKMVDIKLSTTKVSTPSIFDTIVDLRSRVKKLEV